MKKRTVIKNNATYFWVSLLLCFFLFVGQAQAAVEVTAQMIEIAGRPVGEITVNNRVVIRLRTEAGGFNVKERTDIVLQRLKECLSHPENYQNIKPALAGDERVVQVGNDLIVTVDKEVADINHSYRHGLAWVWANNLRTALEIPEIERNPLAYLEPQPAYPNVAYAFSGKASWYGGRFDGRRTASGERFNQNALTAAHRSLPFGTRLRVTNIKNGKTVVVRVNDRGPFVANKILDLSREAAARLNMIASGVSDVKVEVLH